MCLTMETVGALALLAPVTCLGRKIFKISGGVATPSEGDMGEKSRIKGVSVQKGFGQPVLVLSPHSPWRYLLLLGLRSNTLGLALSPFCPLIFCSPSHLTQFCALINSLKLGKGVTYELKRKMLDRDKAPSTSGAGNGSVKSPLDFQGFKPTLFMPLPAPYHSPPFSVSPLGLLHAR